MVRAEVRKTKAGKSTGNADVVFQRKADALEAIRQYNGVTLDGRPMKLSLKQNGQPQHINYKVTLMGDDRRVRNAPKPRAPKQSKAPKQPKAPKEPKVEVTKDDLDADMDAYRATAAEAKEDAQ